MEQPYDYGTQEGYMDQQQQGYGDTNESEKLFFTVAIGMMINLPKKAPCV